MEWQLSPEAFLLVVTGVVSANVVAFAWARRRSPGATPLALLALAATAWALGYALELASLVEPTKLLWAKAEYLGIATAPTAWLVVALQYTGRSRWLTRRSVALLGAMPLATLLLVWTNDAHGLIWSGIELDTSTGLSVLRFSYGPWFWVHLGYAYLLMLLGVVFVSDALFHSGHLYWKQALALIVSAVLPWAANMAYGVEWQLLRGLDPTPFAFTASGLILTWAFLRARMFDVTPVARQAVYENMSEGVLVLDALDRVADYNRTARRILGESASLVVGVPVAEVWSDGLALLQRRAGEETVFPDIEFDVGGGRRTYDVSVSPLNDGRGGVAGLLVLFHDTTERKRLQEQLVRSDRLAAVGTLAAGAAHEINNPLAVVLGHSELMLKRGEMGQAAGKSLQVIVQETRRAAGIVQNLLSFSRQHPPERRELSINDALQMVLDLRSHELQGMDVEMRRELQPDLPPVLADADQLRQVFLNLIINAEQALAEAPGPRVLTVRTRHVDGANYIDIRDSGPGIAPEDLPKVFDPFFTTKPVGEGTGLGLSVSYGIVREHGGTIHVESELGKGTTFMVELPVALANSD